jgi:uncharacterized phosphosugar-binding protein
MKKYIFIFIMALISFAGQAQAPVEMADQFRADGKIYVVIAVVAIIYLFRLDRKITDLEKRIK